MYRNSFSKIQRSKSFQNMIFYKHHLSDSEYILSLSQFRPKSRSRVKDTKTLLSTYLSLNNDSQITFTVWEYEMNEAIAVHKIKSNILKLVHFWGWTIDYMKGLITEYKYSVLLVVSFITFAWRSLWGWLLAQFPVDIHHIFRLSALLYIKDEISVACLI